MESLVPKENFFFCEIFEFERIENVIYKKELDQKTKWRLVIFADGNLFDVKSGEQILPLPEENGSLIGPLYENTRYISYIQQPNRELTEYEISRGQEVYKEYLEKKKLIAEKKLVPFQQKRLV